MAEPLGRAVTAGLIAVIVMLLGVIAILLVLVAGKALDPVNVPGRRRWTYKECVAAGHEISGSGDGSSFMCWSPEHIDGPLHWVSR